MNKKNLLHPYLFSLLPPLILFAQNADRIPVPRAALTLAVVGALAGCLCAVFRKITKSGEISALIVSPLMLVLLSYGGIYEYLKAQGQYAPALIALSALVFPALAFCAYRLARLKEGASVRRANRALTGLSAALVAFNLFNAAMVKAAAKDAVKPALPVEAAPASRPDIYFIVLDQYAGLEESREVFQYDNRGFADFLRMKGFFVAAGSRSLFTRTELSLATSLNMKPVDIDEKDFRFSRLDAVESSLTLEPARRSRLYRLIRDNEVVRFLKARGYRYVHFGSWWYYTSHNANADLNYNGYGFRLKDEFAHLVVKASVFRILFIDKALLRSGVRYEFEKLSDVPPAPGPKFVFAHIMCPHYPYVFEEDGGASPLFDRRPLREQYRAQYRYATAAAERLIDDILKKSPAPPVIIVQSDHGSRMDPRYSRRIFNAVLFPGRSVPPLPAGLSPQNTFRVLFNRYFGAAYPMLDETA